MKYLTFKIKDTDLLKTIGKTLNAELPLSKVQTAFLAKLCNEIPETRHFLEEKISLEDTIQVNLLDMDTLVGNLKKWEALFENIPGYDCAPYSFITIEQQDISKELRELINIGVLIIATFAPTPTYCLYGEGYDVYLKDDGTAYFELPTLKDAEKYPDLYQFKGSWKEAYLLMIETIKKGWPMEEFPKEFEMLLPK